MLLVGEKDTFCIFVLGFINNFELQQLTIK